MAKLKQGPPSKRRRRNLAHRRGRRIIPYESKIKKHKRKIMPKGSLCGGIEEYSDRLQEQSVPLVTFIEKPNPGQQSLNHDQLERNRFQFHLEDSRVNVPEVLHQLGVTKLQYEPQPGLWRALKGHPSGKSINKFQNKQEVYFRTGAAAICRRPQVRDSQARAWVDSWLVEGDTEEAYNARVSRLVQKTSQGRIGIGTMVRVQSKIIPGLMLTCRHCVEISENGPVNENLHAFGGPVTVLYVSEKYDLAICEGTPDTDGFLLAEAGEEEKGREIRMLSFPWHVDLVYGLQENIGPTQVHGHVCMSSPEGCDMPIEVDSLGTYMGGFPASSGGAVTLSSKVLGGIHVGVIWHDKDELSMPLSLRSSGSHKTRSRPGTKARRTTFHLQLCARRGRKQKDRQFSESFVVDNSAGLPTNSNINYCSSSHGYLATYVSAAHIEEAFQDYFQSCQNDQPESSRNSRGSRKPSS